MSTFECGITTGEAMHNLDECLDLFDDDSATFLDEFDFDEACVGGEPGGGVVDIFDPCGLLQRSFSDRQFDKAIEEILRPKLALPHALLFAPPAAFLHEAPAAKERVYRPALWPGTKDLYFVPKDPCRVVAAPAEKTLGKRKAGFDLVVEDGDIFSALKTPRLCLSVPRVFDECTARQNRAARRLRLDENRQKWANRKEPFVKFPGIKKAAEGRIRKKGKFVKEHTEFIPVCTLQG